MITAPNLQEAITLARQGRESMVRCTSHEDNLASVHVTPGHTQPIVMTCHAGCDAKDVLEAAGMSLDDILAPRENQGSDEVYTKAGKASHVYPYHDEEGTLLFEVLRIPLPGGKKTFRQRIADPDRPGKHLFKLGDTRRIIYKLPEVIEAIREGRQIWVVEGEKDVDALWARGEPATTSPMGAGKWADEYSQSLGGASVIIVADKDDAGREHAREVKKSLENYGCAVAVMEAAGTCKDISDHFAAGYTLDDLLETSPETPVNQTKAGVDVLEAVRREFADDVYVIPGTLAEGERVTITGFEGGGKSQLLRQLAVQVAAGIHPFNGKHVPPKRVLYIDSENKPQQVLASWQQLIGLTHKHDRPMEPGHLYILEEWQTQPQITTNAGRDWLFERIHAYRPDLICMGPLYVLADKDLRNEDAVGALIRTVNQAAGLYGTAFIMEHHAPHRGPNDTKRSVRPYGHSTLMRWPDFGFGLQPVDDQEGCFEWAKTRGMRVREREWPEFIRWGKKDTDEWPWHRAFEDEAGDIY